MIFDIIIGTSQTSSVGWTPADLFTGGEVGFWLDGSDTSLMFQDFAGTTPVTASGQSVSVWKNKITAQPRFNFKRDTTFLPTYNLSSGKGRVVFDGIDDYLEVVSTGAITGSSVSAFLGLSSPVIPAERFIFTNGTSGTNLINMKVFDYNTITGVAFGQSQSTGANYSTSLPNIVGMIAGVGTYPLTVRLNGVVSTGATPSAGSLESNFRLPGNSSLPLTLNQMVYINRTLTADEISKLEAFIGSKQ